MQELSAGLGKQPDDYTVVRAEEDVEPYLAAGYSLAEAKAIAESQILLPQLSQVKQAALAAVDLANGYTQAGDATSAQAALQMASDHGPAICQSVVPAEITGTRWNGHPENRPGRHGSERAFRRRRPDRSRPAQPACPTKGSPHEC